jgi:5-methylcytosine-specific restriction endonuclease McrA
MKDDGSRGEVRDNTDPLPRQRAVYVCPKLTCFGLLHEVTRNNGIPETGDQTGFIS